MTPEQVVVRNVQAITGIRRISGKELGRRMSSLGFRAWFWEKSVRNLYNGKRSLKIDELAALAVSLETTIGVLLDPDLTSESTDVEVGLLSGIYSSLLEGSHQLPHALNIATAVRADWDGEWNPGTPENPTPPAVFADPGDAPQFLINVHRAAGWDLPAPIQDLTDDHYAAMRKRLNEYLDETSEGTDHAE